MQELKELKDKYSSCAEKAINSIAKCELKTYDYPVDGDFTATVELFYLKSEADKVIAELKEKYKELAKLHDKAIQACCDADKVIAHHKYKRCVAMAKWCESEENRLEAISPIFDTDKEYWEYDSDYWGKWHDYWLELADKFKEAK